MMSFFSRNKPKIPLATAELLKESRRSEGGLAFQRSFMILVMICTLGLLAFMILHVYATSTNHKVNPFIVEMEERTGLTKVVTAIPQERYENDEKIRNFFLNKYISARETYSVDSYLYNYHTVVRALSSEPIYEALAIYRWRTREYKTDPTELIHIAEKESEVNIDIQSIRPLKTTDHNIPGQAVQIYYTQYMSDSRSDQRNKIATIGFDFNKTFSDDEVLLKELNPLGFQVLYFDFSDVISEKR